MRDLLKKLADKLREPQTQEACDCLLGPDDLANIIDAVLAESDQPATPQPADHYDPEFLGDCTKTATPTAAAKELAKAIREEATRHRPVTHAQHFPNGMAYIASLIESGTIPLPSPTPQPVAPTDAGESGSRETTSGASMKRYDLNIPDLDTSDVLVESPNGDLAVFSDVAALAESHKRLLEFIGQEVDLDAVSEKFGSAIAAAEKLAGKDGD